MCILCVVQKWSRKVATMLPWLVIPLIGLWALSQLLPPGFRFEITSPRLACVVVLLVTLFWYEVLMPQLSAWRARRSARMLERRRTQAMELQKLRKTATRRCRNCLTPYREQNPGGGKFMCSYCGHNSKRPVLELPGIGAGGGGGAGFLGDLVGRGGKMLNGKVWSENGWMCSGQDLSEGGNYWGRSKPAFFSREDSCLPENSYSGVLFFVCKMLATFVLSIRWLWRKLFGVGTGREDISLDSDNKRLIGKKGENGLNCNESKGEKARRKAEEKRQARLEREQLEEEERKQREEVAKLVEEQRRLRDEKLEAEKERNRASLCPDGGKNIRRDTEKRRQEKRRDKDKGSSKSNSDVEELERKSVRDVERKRDCDRKSEVENRDPCKTTSESGKSRASEFRHDGRGIANGFSRVYGGGSRYLDRVKGSFLSSSSRAFNSANFFGRGSTSSAAINMKGNKLSGHGDPLHTPPTRKDVHHAGNFVRKPYSADGKNSGTRTTQPSIGDTKPQESVPKRTWQQLFTGSLSSASTPSQANLNEKLEMNAPKFPIQKHYPISPSFASPPLSVGSTNAGFFASEKINPLFPYVNGLPNEVVPEELELYEDPCYDALDPASLLGPVSESLDNFPLDLGSAFSSTAEFEKPRNLKSLSLAHEVNQRSPVESPISRLRNAEDMHINSILHPLTPRSQAMHGSGQGDSGNSYAPGTYQMWGGAPSFGQDEVRVVGKSADKILPIGSKKLDALEFVHHPSSYQPVTQDYGLENQVFSGSPSPRNVHAVSGNSNGISIPPGLVSNPDNPWLPKGSLLHITGDKENFLPPFNLKDGLPPSEKLVDVLNNPASSHIFEIPPVECWPKMDWTANGAAGASSNSAETHHRGRRTGPDVHSLWAFN